jgi:dethiobiotin synthetase
MPGLFVTATGTDIGKTYVTAGLIRAGRRAGRQMAALKPILTGYTEEGAAASDAGYLLDALGVPVTPASIAGIAPWRFAAPLSPNMAASIAGSHIDVAAVVTTCRAALRPDKLTLVEGIGGVMVPIDERHTVLDLIVALALPVVLVTGTQLGALSHCLTAVEALRSRTRPPDLIVLNESAGSSVPLAATQDTIARFCPESRIALIPRDAAEPDFDRLFAEIAGLVARKP